MTNLALFRYTVRISAKQLLISFLLAASLLFNQAGINFLHDTHDAHQTILADPSEDILLPHGEHCRVCSIDVVCHLFIALQQDFDAVVPQADVHSSVDTQSPTGIVTLIRNKAPPVVTGSLLS